MSEHQGYEPLPAHVDLAEMDRQIIEQWRANKVFERSSGRHGRRRGVDVLRGPADRERHARHPPRRGPGLQGRLPAVQDDEGLPRRPQGRLGLPRPAGRARGREGARLHRQAATSRRTASPSSTHVPGVGAAARRRVRGDDRADGLLGRLRDAYWTMDPDYIECVWWSLKQIFDKGLLVAGPPGDALLPALRHGAVRPRGRAGLPRSPTRRSTCGSR